MTGTTLSEKISIDPFNAFVSCQSDQISTGGPLSDLRVAVKDNIAVAGMPFTAGHPLFSTRRATRNAEVIDRLTRDGARLVGVTRTDAGGLGVLTPEVLNPRSRDHVVGGSSGGAAAAVAGGLADVAIGTDTGGSVRIPAACCGIYGFKPSYGIIPLDGVWPLSERFDTIGIMATRLESLRRVTDVLLQACDSTSGRIASKIAVDFRRLSDWQAEVREPIRQKIQSLVRRGVIISEVSLPNWLETLEAHGRLVLADARQVYADVWPKREKELGAAARRALTIAANLTKEEIQSAETAVRHANEMIARVFDTNDIILSPTLPIPPPRRDLRRVTLGGIDLPVSLVMMSETCLANIAGTPALVSTAATSGGQDGGSLQLMAPYGQDSRLFDFAEWMEQMPGP